MTLEQDSGHRLTAGLAISPTTELYYHEMADQIKARFPDCLIRTEWSTHDNDMPLILVGQADKTVMVSWINGDNFPQAFTEIGLFGDALTANPDAAGANTNHLWLFCPFIDFRQHDRTRKPIPETTGKAIVKAQGVTDRALANLFKHVAGAEAVFMVEGHNIWRSGRWFREAGLDLINLTTNQITVDYLHNQGYLTPNLENIVVSADIGGLPNAPDAS